MLVRGPRFSIRFANQPDAPFAASDKEGKSFFSPRPGWLTAKGLRSESSTRIKHPIASINSSTQIPQILQTFSKQSRIPRSLRYSSTPTSNSRFDRPAPIDHSPTNPAPFQSPPKSPKNQFQPARVPHNRKAHLSYRTPDHCAHKGRSSTFKIHPGRGTRVARVRNVHRRLLSPHRRSPLPRRSLKPPRPGVALQNGKRGGKKSG